MAGDNATSRYALRDWLGIFHPAYRSYLAGLMGIGIVVGILTYFNLELLQSLVKTFAVIGHLDTIGCRDAADIHFLTELIVCSGLGSGWTVAILVLLAYAGLELLQAALSILQLFVGGRLEIKSRNDIEREVLVNLMRKDDQFFHRQSATQITNRLSEDTERMFERREDISKLWAVTLQAIGALYFLWSQNWSYAAVVLISSLAGVYIIHLMLAEMKELDGAQLQSDDNVKGAFEDYLYAVPETQMGNLSGKITDQLAVIQGERQSAFMGLVTLSGKLTATYSLTQLVAFGAIMCAIIYVVIVHGLTLEDGLVAAVVRAVPQIYGNISEVAAVYLKFQLADVSAKRLLEFETEAELDESPAAPAAAETPSPSAVVFDKVRYTYTPGGPRQGGPNGISLTIAPGTLNVVMGPSGSGKSMLSQLLMGRLKPIAGQVRHGESDIGELGQLQRSGVFSYMPQSLAMVTGSIEDNILFGLPGSEAPGGDGLDDEVLAWIDKAAVGRFTREKSLDLPPGDADLGAFADGLKSLRQGLRKRVGQEAGVSLTSFADKPLVPHLSILEHMTGGAAYSEKMLPLAFSRPGFQMMDCLAALHGAESIIEFGRHIISRTLHMLTRSPSYDAYCELAPFRISPPAWDLRSRLAGDGPIEAENTSIHGDLMLVGLTATPQEADAATVQPFADVLGGENLTELKKVASEYFTEALEPLDEDLFNGALNWRDNLLFGTPKTINTPTARAVDQVLLKAVASIELDRMLLQTGLRYQVGRQGKRLSGGQRQLICLCRTFLQGSPILVFDEPTAALDPRHRAAMNSLLRDSAGQHTIVAITHDVELARLADQVIMMKDGQIWAHGPFEDLVRENAEFRALTNSREVAAS